MEDKDKRNATKHYQNSDYPSGSFEAAINADQHDRLREGQGLRLERHPLGPGHSGADLEEMVPAFMHRDFFRSEEDAVESVGTSRLRAARREAGKEVSREVSKELPRELPRTPSPEEPKAAAPRPAYIPPPDTESYQEPPQTETPAAPSEKPKTSFERPRSERPAAPPEKPTAPPVPRAEESLPPLRSADSAPAPEARPLRAEAPRSAPPSPEPVTTPAQPAPQIVQQPNYSVPMLIALAMVLGVFVWREQSRTPLPAQEALPVPVTVASPAAPTPMPEPTVAGVGFRPTYMAVGPSVPQGIEAEASASPIPGETAGPEESVSEEEADDRAAILEQMSQSSAAEEPAPAAGGGGGDLFPGEGGEESAPTNTAPVREAASAPWTATLNPTSKPAPPKPKPPAARPAAAKPAPKPAAKPAASKPKAVPVAATAADLFPIDDEVPIRSSKPAAKAAAAPVSQPAAVPIAAPAAGVPADGYQIDEPNL